MKVALLTQEMAPDTISLLFLFPGSRGANDGENMLLYC